MNPMLGLGLLLVGLLTAEGLLKPSFPPNNHGIVKQFSAWKSRRVAQELARRNTQFGFKLFKKLATNKPSKNIFFSPLSISTAFSMLCLGAQDSTQAEIKQGFNFRDMSEKDLHEGFHTLIPRLNQGNQDLSLGLENALFVDQKVQLEPKFQKNVKKMYNADTIPADFHNLENARQQINDYVSQKTQGMIDDLINSIAPGTVMLLINCIFFRARWQQEFDPKETKEEDFLMDGNKTAKVPMMSHGGMYEVGRDDELACTVLEMPYQGNITATFILPDEGKMKTVEKALKTDTLARWKTVITRRVADVSMPKFSITGTYDLKKMLSYLGVSKVFEEHGDLTRISPNHSLKVSEAVHKATMRMDEKGTEAAAGSGAQTLPMEKPLSVKMNRPFLLVITEKTTSSLLFLGKITDPTENYLWVPKVDALMADTETEAQGDARFPVAIQGFAQVVFVPKPLFSPDRLHPASINKVFTGSHTIQTH
ncbi:PREDICTED: serpin A12 [Condylura cristata]|uniref:serpin A12 n=1 Tax=Condylura cristata TaxID=143302 RepID=UPI0006438DF3|nr:PREDICTED: serpin A12 [Condylura cristata]